MSVRQEGFIALRCRNFRLYLLGQAMALTGLWMSRLCMSWLVFKLTHSAFLLSIIEFMGLAPILVIGALAGAWLDTHDLRRTLIISQAACLVQALVLAALNLTGVVEYWHLIILALTLGTINAVDLPARQSSVSFLVDSYREMKSAIALNSMVFNCSRLAGPSLAGVIIYHFGEGVGFLIAALLYVPIITLLITCIRYRPRVTQPKKQSMVDGVREGIAYIRSEFVLRKVFFLTGWSCLFWFAYQILFPVFVTKVLGGDSKLLGMLFGGVGAGALVALLFMSMRVTLEGIPRWQLFVGSVLAFGMTVFGFSTSVPLSIFMTLFIGFGVVTMNVGSNTLLQTVSAEDKRSRVLSLYLMCNNGVGPSGGLLMGAIADVCGAPATMIGCAVCLAVILALYGRDCGKITERLNEMMRDKE